MKLIAAAVSLIATAFVAASVGSSNREVAGPPEFVASETNSHPLTTAGHLGGVVPALQIGETTSTESWQKPRAHSEPHGHQQCASGCAVSHHPTRRLSVDECRDLLVAYQETPFDQQSDALDALLYYGVQTQVRLRKESLRNLLDTEHVQSLNKELSRDRAVVAIRIVDQSGKVRANLPPTEVPQHVRQVFEFDVYDIQPLICSGTVKRVGKNHIWQRL